jgi:hypothetical protein
MIVGYASSISQKVDGRAKNSTMKRLRVKSTNAKPWNKKAYPQTKGSRKA